MSKRRNTIDFKEQMKVRKQAVKRLWKTITAFFANLSLKNMITYGFYAIIAISIINVTLMTIYRLDQDYKYPIFKTSYVSAVYQGQDVNDIMYTDIITIKKFDPSSINTGDLLVVFGDFNIDEYWVETVISNNPGTNSIEVTYDQLSSITLPYSDIVGTYQKKSNIFGTLYYTSRFSRGFTLLLISNGFILSVYYIGLIDPRRHQELK